jgi:colicin import membrane protein
MSIRRSLERLWVLGACLAALASAHAEDDLAAQRARIATERAQVQAKASVAEVACAREFAVSACVTAVRAERRASLQQLDRQRALIDDAQRKQRAAERMARLRARQEAAAREGERPPVQTQARTPAPSAGERSDSQAHAEQARRAAMAAQAASAAADGDAKAVARASALARRQREAAAHRTQVEQRNKVRAEEKPPAKPLPASASAPG